MPETKKYYHNLDVDGNQVLNLLLNPLTTTQRLALILGVADEGYVTYDTTLNQLFFWTGISWVTTTGATTWGSIAGLITNQTDLITYLSSNYTPLSRNLTINGTTYDLSADRTWTIDSLPSQTGNSGYWLTTNGSTASWQPLGGNISAFTNDANYITLTSLSAGTGISYNNLTGVITNSAPDQVVSLTSGSGISITGTYPSFTIAATNSGTVTSVTASSPLSSSGGATPNISISQASGSTDGYLSSIDWTTFNNKQNTITLTTTGSSGSATFISNTLNIPTYTLAGLGGVSGSGTTNYVSKWTSSTGLGNSLIQDDGIRIGIGGAPVSPYPVHIAAVGGYGLAVRNTTTTTKLTQVNDGSITFGDGSGNYASIENLGTSGTLTYTSLIHWIKSSSATAIYIPNTANVLIGTTSDGGYKLDVNGTARFVNEVAAGGATVAGVNLSLGSGIAANANMRLYGGVGGSRYFSISHTTSEAIIDWTNNTGGVGTRGLILQSGAASLTVANAKFSTVGFIVATNSTNPSMDASAIIQADSDRKGLLPPRMTSAQRAAISTPATGLCVYQTDGIEGIYERTSSGWRIINTGGTVTSVGLSAGTGISIGGTNPVTSSGTITVTNTAPDQVVALTAGTATTITGTYPNFTIGASYTPVNKAGDTMTGFLTLVGDPTLPLHAATKEYVDLSISAGLTIHDPVRVETQGNLAATYTNGGTTPTWTDITTNDTLTTGSAHGLITDNVIVFSVTTNGIVAGTPYFVYDAPTPTTIRLSLTHAGPVITTLTNGTGLTITSRANSGVGAKLTNAGTQVALTVDGVLLSVGNRVLVYLQTNGFENGIYDVTNTGSPSTNWELTRSANENTYDPKSTSALGEGDYFFVQEGITSAGESYVLTTPGTIVFGTTNLTFTQFAKSIPYTGGTNIDVTGQVISLTGQVAVANGGTGASTLTGALIGNGTSPVTSVTGTAGQILRRNLADTAYEFYSASLGYSRSINSVSTNTAAGSTAATDYIYLVTGITTITLPTAVGNTNLYSIKNVGNNTVSVTTIGGQTIDGSSTITLPVKYTSLDFISDGTNWNIV